MPSCVNAINVSLVDQIFTIFNVVNKEEYILFTVTSPPFEELPHALTLKSSVNAANALLVDAMVRIFVNVDNISGARYPPVF